MDLRRPANSSATILQQGFLDVSAMSVTARIEESLRRSIPMVPLASQDFIRALISPRALAEITATITLWGTSQLVGAGELADLLLLLAGSMMLGKTALDAGKELVAFGSVIVRARVSKDLDTAAQHFAAAVVLAGVTTISALLLRNGGLGKTSASLAMKTEGTAARAIGETPYQQAVKILDLKVIKKMVIEGWQEPQKWPVKVIALREGQKLGDPVAVDGFITTERSVAGASLRELERRMGFERGYLGNSAAIVRFDRLPVASEFDLRFYNNIHGGGVKPPDPRFPLGPGYPQWELLQKISGRITQIISK